MTRIRLISPRVEPPKDRPVQWFFSNGRTDITNRGEPLDNSTVIAWCEPAKADGTVSGPVHSLEPMELPEIRKPVSVRSHGHWCEGFWTGSEWRAYKPDGCDMYAAADAWRPLPDDEPGDAELLDAARKVVSLPMDGLGHGALCVLAALVRKRTGGGK